MLCFPVSPKEHLTSPPLQNGKTKSLNFCCVLTVNPVTYMSDAMGHVRGCVWKKGCREMASEHQLSWGSLSSRVAGEEWWEQDGPEPVGLSSLVKECQILCIKWHFLRILVSVGLTVELSIYFECVTLSKWLCCPHCPLHGDSTLLEQTPSSEVRPEPKPHSARGHSSVWDEATLLSWCLLPLAAGDAGIALWAGGWLEEPKGHRGEIG